MSVATFPATSTRLGTPVTQPTPLVVDELVVNWHVTEACNYRCRYCYSTWQRASGQSDVIRDAEAGTRLLDTLWQFFRPDNVSHPLRQMLHWSHVRLSFAGGEAMLYPQQVARLAHHAHQLGMRVSLITNGSRLPSDNNALVELAQSLDVLGLSLDAFSTQRNQAIGRTDAQGRTVSLQNLTRQLAVLRNANPSLQVKVNTVVNALNAGDDLRQELALLRPDRWKVLRMLPVLGQELAVSDAAFADFVARHADAGPQTSVEDHQDMLGSYIMIDPQGRFFQNATGHTGSYFYSPPITASNVEHAFLSVPFSAQKFAARYAGVTRRYEA